MKEALKLALEVLKGLKSMYGGNGHKLHEINMIHRKHDTAITALEEALAQSEQEPVQTTQTSIVFYNGNSPLEESEVLRITKDGITVNPAFKPDEAAAAVLRALDSQIKNLMTRPEQEPVAKVVSTAPERIWLDLGFAPSDEDEISFNDLVDATWSHDNATGFGIEYVRADIAAHGIKGDA